MNIEPVKSFLRKVASNGVVKATSEMGLTIADIYGLVNGGKSYMFGLRPAVLGLHAHFWSKANRVNVGYRALSMPFGEIINSLPPVKKAVNFVSRVVGTATFHLTKKFSPSMVSPRLPAIFAAAYTEFRANHFLWYVLPFHIASQFGKIDKKPDMSPGKFQTFIWLLFMLLSLVPDEEPKKQVPPTASAPAIKKQNKAASKLSAKEQQAVQNLQQARALRKA